MHHRTLIIQRNVVDREHTYKINGFRINLYEYENKIHRPHHMAITSLKFLPPFRRPKMPKFPRDKAVHQQC